MRTSSPNHSLQRAASPSAELKRWASQMNNLPTLRLTNTVGIAFTILVGLAPAHPSFGQGNDDRQLGQKFLYCGNLSMRLLRLQEQADATPGKYKDQEDRVYMRMLLTAGAYIPSSELSAEYKAASDRLTADVQATGGTSPTEPNATAKFLHAAYLDCLAHEKLHGQAAFLKGAARARAEAVSPPAAPASVAP